MAVTINAPADPVAVTLAVLATSVGMTINLFAPAAATLAAIEAALTALEGDH